MILVDNKGHLVSPDSLIELHLFAERLGLKRRWFQNHAKYPHYSLCRRTKEGIYKPYKYKIEQAIELGAVPVTSRELIKSMKHYTKGLKPCLNQLK